MFSLEYSGNLTKHKLKSVVYFSQAPEPLVMQMNLVIHFSFYIQFPSTCLELLQGKTYSQNLLFATDGSR